MGQVIKMYPNREEFKKKDPDLKKRKRELKKQGHDVYEIKSTEDVLLIWKEYQDVG